MAIDKESKQKTITKYKMHDKDSGSAFVQIVLLTQRIRTITEHLKKHRKDIHSRYGLIKLVSKRRRLIRYLMAKNSSKCKELLRELKLRY